jgi:type I restriction enzyme R subunit
MPLEPANPAPQPINKKALSERDICSKFVTPALVGASWDHMNQIREEVSFTKGRVIVRGKLSTCGAPKRADYVLYHKPGIPLAVIEAKDNNHSVVCRDDARSRPGSTALFRRAFKIPRSNA